jgi:hypothetical protein
MDIYAEWIDPRSREKCRIKFDVDSNKDAVSHMRRKLWEKGSLKIFDSAYDRLTRTHSLKFRSGSTVFIDTETTTQEIIEGVKTYMKEIYGAAESNLVVSVSF